LAALATDQLDDFVGADAPVGLIVGMQADVDVRPERLAFAHVLGERVEAGQRIGRDRRTDPLDRVAVVVVMRRLDHHEMEQFRSHAIPSERPKCHVRRHPSSFCQITAPFCPAAGAPTANGDRAGNRYISRASALTWPYPADTYATLFGRR